MRIVSYRQDGRCHAGVVRNGSVLDLVELARSAGVALDPDRDRSLVRQLLAAGPAALDRVRSAWSNATEVPGRPLSELTLLAPVPDPAKIICVGLNWRAHSDEVQIAATEVPTLFAKFATALAGDGALLVRPAVTTQLDYEAELAVVIGSRARRVAAADALRYVAGYTCFNDVSARDLQLRTSQWISGKALDGFAPCGPALVTADEVGDPQDLRIRTRVNGTVVQDDTTANMIFGVAELIAHISQLITLEPGDIVATGTPPGVGLADRRFLRHGDELEITIDRVGTLRSRVADEVPDTDHRTAVP